MMEYASRIDPTDSYPHYLLAGIYLDRNQNVKAKEHALKAISIDPTLRFDDRVFSDMMKEIEKRLGQHIGVFKE